jgi:predicted nucleotidyltransferase
MWQGIDPESAKIREWSLGEVKRIVLDHLGDHPARVYLFGSCATGRIHRFSDIDVAIEPSEPLPITMLSDINEALEESTVPYFVDMVDLSSASADLRREVHTEGVLWRA